MGRTAGANGNYLQPPTLQREGCPYLSQNGVTYVLRDRFKHSMNSYNWQNLIKRDYAAGATVASGKEPVPPHFARVGF